MHTNQKPELERRGKQAVKAFSSPVSSTLFVLILVLGRDSSDSNYFARGSTTMEAR
ncbi:hypothetical protein ARMSODRAFT_950467 [Armillaria solidipes]|uniref:Uncharacterized protein n=1 Tax=Armillaria solidipes TaxID=1076256 RepID=A0A2H3BZ39_9AGAR|nr:hypothetical protein ARMSODRAFT_950467 [Armillaria solidipes]